MAPDFPCPACGAALAVAPATAAPVTLPADDPVVERLRRWRRERAARDGVSAYVVLPNAALVAIARTRPPDLAALAGVRGVGPARLERYGGEILAALEPDGLLS